MSNKRTYDRNYMQSLLAFNIMRQMEDKKVTVHELAIACEVTTSSIKQLIAGEQFIGARVLSSICNYLEVSPDELFKEPRDAETENNSGN